MWALEYFSFVSCFETFCRLLFPGKNIKNKVLTFQPDPGFWPFQVIQQWHFAQFAAEALCCCKVSRKLQLQNRWDAVVYVEGVVLQLSWFCCQAAQEPELITGCCAVWRQQQGGIWDVTLRNTSWKCSSENISPNTATAASSVYYNLSNWRKHPSRLFTWNPQRHAGFREVHCSSPFSSCSFFFGAPPNGWDFRAIKVRK